MVLVVVRKNVKMAGLVGDKLEFVVVFSEGI